MMSHRASTNRKVTILVHYSSSSGVNGGKTKVIKSQINFNQKNYESFKKLVETNLRLSPEDPVTEVSNMCYKTSDGLMEQFQDSNYEHMKSFALQTESIVLQVSVNIYSTHPKR